MVLKDGLYKVGNRVFFNLSSCQLLNWIPDKLYLQIAYRLRTQKKLHLKNPSTFNEKIQWLKLYERNDWYTKLVDKYEVRQYVKNKIGEKYLVPLCGGPWSCFNEIDWAALPERFVLKCTHDSGGLVICEDKNNIDRDAVQRKMETCLKRNYYLRGREWPYKNALPRIIAEKLLVQPGKKVPEDYKVYCMNGKPRYIVIFHNRFNEKEELSESVYDTQWKRYQCSFDNHFKICPNDVKKPECLEELLEVASILCQHMTQARVDFYIINNKIYFGEITLHTASGFQPMIPEYMDEKLGEEIILPR